MTANDTTPTEGKDSIDWEVLGKDALAMLLDRYRIDTNQNAHEVIEAIRNDEEVSREDLLKLRNSVEGQFAVIESVIAENLDEVEPRHW